MKKIKTPIFWLILSLVLIFTGSFFASYANSSGGSVDVERIHFETTTGELSGLLYTPEGANQEPRPTLITTHGYLNSGEMQAPQAIEMSKRGYVVLALDLYDHGHSVNTEEKEVEFFSFWPTAMYDAVQYMYEQDYVLKDGDSNGIIAVSGHSMGGFSSTHSVMLDEMDYQTNGYRKIFSSLTMGSDYWWLSFLGYSDEDINATYGPRSSGKIAGVYDEFFFDNEANAAGTPVIEKDYIATEEGQNFLGNPDTVQAGEVYEVDGGSRIIYQPNETHPWNHFSMTTTGHAIDFYDMTFSEYDDLVTIGEDGQTWMAKEWLSFVSLIGFFMLFIPVILLIAKLPFFRSVYSPKATVISQPKTTRAKAGNYALMIFGGLFPALFFTALYSGEEAGMRLLTQSNIVLLATAIIVLIYSLVKNTSKHIRNWSIAILVISVIQFLLFYMQEEFIATTETFGGPTINPIVYWAINVAIIMLILMVSTHYFRNKPTEGTLSPYGLKVNIKTIAAGFALAVIAVLLGYALLFIVDALFTVDFRLWVFAVKTFRSHHFFALLRYAPLFFIYFFVAGVSVNINTVGEKFRGIKGYIAAILHFIGGLLLYLVYHYGLLFTTGVGGYPAESLSSIVMIGLVPVLAIAAVFNRFLFKKTGNMYTGAFLNTILMTMITIANTALFTVI